MRDVTHAHNEKARATDLATRALEEDVVLVSDAGTPGVSDPGRFVVAAALELGVEVRSVPGPSALARPSRGNHQSLTGTNVTQQATSLRRQQ